ncbi:MAG: hypothetical protein RIS35_2375 [Pseudomonadota bacterium]|jgi:hypothetical protein
MRILLLALILSLLPPSAMAIEEPAHEVVQRLDDVEVRQYAPYVVAEVLVDGPADEAGNTAFPILAGYIFGKNRGARKLEMTAPVTQTAAPVKLEMTAPVTQTPTPGGYVVQFVLPRTVTRETAPEPIDPRVKLREVPGRRIAVIRYSGFWSQSNYDEHLSRLQAALRTAGIRWTGEPTLSRYDPPFKPWFLRRNEIWLELEQASGSGPAR